MYKNAERRLVKAHFQHDEIDYTLQITDPVIEDMMWDGPDRTLGMPGSLLCVSFQAKAYP